MCVAPRRRPPSLPALSLCISHPPPPLFHLSPPPPPKKPNKKTTDWGTAIPATGIHGEIELVASDRASVLNTHVVSQKRVNGTDGDVFSLDVEVLLSSPPAGDAGTVYVDVALPNGRHVTAQGDATLPSSSDVVSGGAASSRLPDGGREFAARLKLDVPASAVELWWPVGYGKQPLYPLTAGFRPKGDDCGGKGEGAAFLLAAAPPGANDTAAWGESSTDPKIRASALAKKPYAAGGACTAARRRVGFRTIELVETPAKKAAAGDLRASWTSPLDPNMWPSWFRPDEQWATIDDQWSYLGGVPLFWGPTYPSFGGYPFSYPPIGLTTPPTVDDPQAEGGKRPARWTDGDSEAMYFRVNGVPVYSKGSNIIPFSMLPVNVTAALVDRTIDAAAATHQNTLRVWGGGYYMPDYVHDTLDERGILGWLETPFACNVYPTHMPGFLENVRQEVTQQVRRLGGHASTALFGGNNEVEASFGWYTNTRANAPLYVSEYTALFVDAIGGVMSELAPATPYLDSSPSNGHAQKADPAKGVKAVKRWGVSFFVFARLLVCWFVGCSAGGRRGGGRDGFLPCLVQPRAALARALSLSRARAPLSLAPPSLTLTPAPRRPCLPHSLSSTTKTDHPSKTTTSRRKVRWRTRAERARDKKKVARRPRSCSCPPRPHDAPPARPPPTHPPHHHPKKTRPPKPKQTPATATSTSTTTRWTARTGAPSPTPSLSASLAGSPRPRSTRLPRPAARPTGTGPSRTLPRPTTR